MRVIVYGNVRNLYVPHGVPLVFRINVGVDGGRGYSVLS